jgi:4-amino-4-deoxy-L-arabinose transferase-like glycosyltransferase
MTTTPAPSPTRPALLNRLPDVVVRFSAAVTVVASMLAGRIERFSSGYFDEGIYRLLANNLLVHGFYGYEPGGNIAYRAPGYPFFLAGLRWLVDAQWFTRTVQALMAGVTVMLAAWIANRLFGLAAAAVTAALLAITGTLAAYGSFELSETLATFMLVSAAAVALLAFAHDSTRIAWCAGVLLGLSVLTRPQALILIPALAVWIGFAFGSKRRLRAGFALILGAVIAIAPWTIRNASRLDAFVPVSSYGGVSLWLSNNPHADGHFRPADQMAGPAEYARISALPEVDEDHEWFRLAFAYMRAHPGKTLRNWVRDGAIFAGSRDTYPRDRLVIRESWSPPLLDDRVLWPLALAGGVLALRRRNDRAAALLPAVVVAAFVAFFMVFLPLARFRHGIQPFLAIYAAAALTWLGTTLIQRLRLQSAEA